MNINLIYEGNKFQFDVPQTITIEYIKGLSSKIFGKNPQMNLFYKGENLLKYSDNILFKDIIKEDETNIIINVQKSELQTQSTDSPKVFSNSSIDNSTTANDNEIFYQEHKKKFIKFQKTFTDIMKEISLFDEQLNEKFNQIMKLQKEYKKYIKIIDEKLSKFYDNSSYDYLFQIFDNNLDSKSLNESDINKIGTEIEKCIFNYKYLQVQKNYQENIISYIQFKIDELLSLNPFINQINGIEEFNNFIKQIEIIFNELNNTTYNFKPKNLLSSFLNLKFEDLNLDHSSRLQYYKYQKTMRKINGYSLSEIPPLVINDINNNNKKYHLKSNSNNKPFTNFKISDIPKVNIDSLKLNKIYSIPSFPNSKNKGKINDIDNEDYLISQTLPNNNNKKDKLFNKSLSPKLKLNFDKKEKIVMPKIMENENKNIKKKENKSIDLDDKSNENLNKKENEVFIRNINKKNTIANKILEEKRKEIEYEVQLFKEELKSKKKKKKKKKELKIIEESKDYQTDKEIENIEKSSIIQKKKKKIKIIGKEEGNNKINENNSNDKENNENKKKNKNKNPKLNNLNQEKKEIDSKQKNNKENKEDNKEKQKEIKEKKYKRRDDIDLTVLTQQKEEKGNFLKTATVNWDKYKEKNLNKSIDLNNEKKKNTVKSTINKEYKMEINKNENEKKEENKEKENKIESDNKIVRKQKKKFTANKNLPNLNLLNIPKDNNNISFNSMTKDKINNFINDDVEKLKDDLSPIHQVLNSSNLISKNVLTNNYNNESNKELVTIVKNINKEENIILEKQNENNQNYNSDSGKKKKSKKKSFNKFDFII